VGSMIIGQNPTGSLCSASRLKEVQLLDILVFAVKH